MSTLFYYLDSETWKLITLQTFCNFFNLLWGFTFIFIIIVSAPSLETFGTYVRSVQYCIQLCTIQLSVLNYICLNIKHSNNLWVFILFAYLWFYFFDWHLFTLKILTSFLLWKRQIARNKEIKYHFQSYLWYF